ncbi:electron transfer flavoprotein subunit alpha/FixB family protein [Loigolactobacillus rennini]|uniref:Electron transfer flavoprotein subunit alpha n=1 Tax=Loigolactobacillus rennini DSM 20253 TaxID=1423796 RepID=A0A0R2D846_9LACO|nr:electron transfer flavoprotein subunit alpha/FixB family protein [Loigolactobacillus rennini]KRM99538.1 electron transfer flavoprotein subunit alpha [Loigolactobacillus rennini DSM 20253]
MARLKVHQDKIDDPEALVAVCPFGSMSVKDGNVVIDDSCRMCLNCVNTGPKGAVEFIVEKKKKPLKKERWQGVAVYVAQVDGEIHPVTYELIGKAKELAGKLHQPVYALLIGSQVQAAAKELQHYGIDKIFVYDDPKLARFAIEPYTAVFERFIKQNKPNSILVGATTVGRQLAPRVAARMRTGLTADTTILDMDAKSTDLSQIRPAFGGNIIAHIVTPNNRPQMATVRYKVMDAAPRQEEISGEIVEKKINEKKLVSNEKIIDIIPKPAEQSIESADVLVAAGRGVKSKAELDQLKELANLLGGQLAGTRPLVENGWIDVRQQIGLSGRTVRPKLIICVGISGAIQFIAGMDNADNIVAINNDPKATIFKSAHYCLVGDQSDIIPQLIADIKARKGE